MGHEHDSVLGLRVFPVSGSGINLADIDNDLDLDLITGGWWQPVRFI